METVLPDGCGNAPRVSIVADVVSAWTARDDGALSAMLAESAVWRVVGAGQSPEAGAADALAALLGADALVRRIEFDDIITHGRLASCTGRIVAADAAGNERAIEFSHHLRFAGAAKTAPVAAVRTFLGGGSTR
ncbi:hypothetical protein [Zhihengliuella salsuginis]|uniref:SnoaL-like domain-containing protein n=1 Tax=Zhihengliuella salsuginis TaxID=578222 RepID=A0ABQ3GLM4_9MICC|nr:hypothetical protein [Zhihengliuella salsuginis]GHD10218.1 hypothetical protein GCM10008096_23560 [Zhihengliuella salsuginis]